MNKVSVVIVFSIILLVYGGLNFYIGRKLFNWSRMLFPHINGTIFTVMFSLLVVSLFIRFIPLPTSVKGVMDWISSYWMGIFVYLLLFFVVVDLLLLVSGFITPIPKSIHFYTGLTVILLTISFVSYGIYNANQIQNVSYEIKTKETKIASHMKIVLISDLHLGAVNSEKRLATIIHNMNALKPDIVCIAGDIFNDDYRAIKNPEKAIDLLKSISATYGVYGILGNHDGGKTFPQMLQFLKESHVTLLNDTYVIVDERLALFGRVDSSPIGGYGELKREDISEMVDSLNPKMPIVVMDHTPNKLEQYSEKVDLILSGHTHKGQIFPANFITNAVFDVDYGYYQKNAASPQVIVSSGVGTWGMPMRVGSNNEIVTIELN